MDITYNCCSVASDAIQMLLRQGIERKIRQQQQRKMATKEHYE